MKICIKMWMKHVFINIFTQIFMSFYEGQLKQHMLYTVNVFMFQMLFSQIQQAPTSER